MCEISELTVDVVHAVTVKRRDDTDDADTDESNGNLACAQIANPAWL